MPKVVLGLYVIRGDNLALPQGFKGHMMFTWLRASFQRVGCLGMRLRREVARGSFKAPPETCSGAPTIAVQIQWHWTRPSWEKSTKRLTLASTSRAPVTLQSDRVSESFGTPVCEVSPSFTMVRTKPFETLGNGTVGRLGLKSLGILQCILEKVNRHRTDHHERARWAFPEHV